MIGRFSTAANYSLLAQTRQPQQIASSPGNRKLRKPGHNHLFWARNDGKENVTLSLWLIERLERPFPPLGQHPFQVTALCPTHRFVLRGGTPSVIAPGMFLTC
jgi:hypothetical protein